jgi:hypothetical protein
MPGPGRPFPKGRSENPGGRPKALADVQAYARQQTNTAIDVLASIMSDEKASPAARIAAANALLDRGYGKPSSIVDTHIDENRDVRELTKDELDTLLYEALEQRQSQDL